MATPDDPARAHAARRFTGIANLVRALRNLGLIRVGFEFEHLGSFPTDDGHGIPVKVMGQGRPIVLVHGLGCSHAHWTRVARRLAQRYRTYIWDARGHGDCRLPPTAAITLPRLARDLANLIEFFRLEEAVLVGHSMGALTVMQYLQDFGTARVAAVGFVDQSPRIVTDDQWRLGLFGGCSAAMLTGLIHGARRNLAETVLHEIEAAVGERLRGWLAPDAALGRALRNWLGRIEVAPLLELCESLTTADFRPLLPRLDVPVLVVLGGKSAHYAGVPLDAYYRSTLPYSQVVVYPGAGHSPHYAEPARFARELESFIGEFCV
jgi:pimeloyl-ACP methyl ester carboxylesterase